MSLNETIRIALIDDHTLFRSGIKALLTRQDNYEVVGEAADGLSGVKLVEQTRRCIARLGHACNERARSFGSNP